MVLDNFWIKFLTIRFHPWIYLLDFDTLGQFHTFSASCFPLGSAWHPAWSDRVVPDQRTSHLSPSLNPEGDPCKWAKNRGQTRATPAAGGVPKTQSKHANKIPEARVRCIENIKYDSSQRKEQIKDTVITQRTVQW